MIDSEVQGPAASVSIYDARPFFEKALHYGVQHGVIDSQKLELIRAEAPKGMVQIARYFGSEFLRPEIEKARERMVSLSACIWRRVARVTCGRLQNHCAIIRFCPDPKAVRTC